MRQIHYISGSRADFGLMRRCLEHLDAQPDLALGLVLTGQHTAAKYAVGRKDIEATGLTVVADIPVSLTGASGHEMGTALAVEMLGFLELWSKSPPDLVLVLGDRGEMLAATLAAVHLGIHVGHIHGGERSGTLDESFRHAISKLAHYHFPATEDAAHRLSRMGEAIDQITTIGAPGLVGLKDVLEAPKTLADRYNLTPIGPSVLTVFHPVVQEASDVEQQIKTLLEFLSTTDCHGVLMRPNSDAGADAIDRALDHFAHTTNGNRFAILDHLERDIYLQSLFEADIMIGNSSSGIIESASFGTACLNIGSRQNGRLFNDNTTHCTNLTLGDLADGFAKVTSLKAPFHNQYGDGTADRRLTSAIRDLSLNPAHLSKFNQY